ncbi:hypothetical protein H0A36_26225 [Endozoicomonas sp. SM1973]|uniref:Uncharacterized protein n=1 Tax=Spartinivicinus marinus TaxID=2994442 RepID=A0A853I9F7_9GAMM|nr:DUF5992 family protein [Spartinivicinus marinus]MCX4030493.1 DUF5992 family protein [Spartinivicinus marinus]NYZ69519.1 hypothetical protein [Spartinivicinus marinus]
MKIFQLFFIMLSVNIAIADPLVTNAKITGIGNTPDGTESFFVTTSGGTGPCATGVIVFPESISSQSKFNRAYSTALTAYTTGNERVNIETLTAGETNCRMASFIYLR